MPEAHRLSPRSTRIVATHAALAGLCPLIPVPFVDDMVIGAIVDRMNRALFAAHGFRLPAAGAKILRETPANRLRAVATAVALYPLKKIVRKLVYVLAVKDCAEVGSAVFHDGWLLARVLEDARAAGDETSPADLDHLRRVRAATLATYAEVDPAPLRRALLSSFRGAGVGLKHGVQVLQRLLRERRRGKGKVDAVKDGAAPDGVHDLVDRVTAATRSEWQYMDALEQAFRRHLEAPAIGDEQASASA